MPLPPIQALGALAAAAPLAEAAVSGAAETFANLLKAAANRGESQPAADNSSGRGAVESPAIPNAAGDSKLKAQTESLLRQFHQLLSGLMDDHNIDPHNGFQLQAGVDGDMQVVGNSTAKPQLQDMIGTRPKLKQLFDSIVANANLLRLVEGSTTGQQQPPVKVVVDAERATLA